MLYYKYGLRGEIIWTTHILMGIFFVLVGYQTLNNKKINQILSLILINLGVLGALYHSHIWYETKKKD